jgi:hypothetical protein
MQFIAYIDSDGRWPTCTDLIAFIRLAAACEGCALAGRHYCSMEVDYGPIDECKEGGDASLVDVSEHDDGSSTDFPMQIDQGQLHISR